MLDIRHGSSLVPNSIAEPPVSAADVRGAVKLVGYFKSHLARIGHQMTTWIGSADAKALVDWIKRHRLTTFRVAEVREHLRRFRNEPADLAAALDVLKALGAIRLRPESPESGKRGPKFSPAYDVHPDLLGAPDNSANSANSPPEPPTEAISGIDGINGRIQGGGIALPPQDRNDPHALSERRRSSRRTLHLLTQVKAPQPNGKRSGRLPSWRTPQRRARLMTFVTP